MSNRVFNAEFNFLENCNYNESISYKDIVLPLQQVYLTLSVQNLNIIGRSDNKNYYNDTFQITALIKNGIEADASIISNGSITFYYIKKDDGAQLKEKINNTPIDIDINGNASIIFMPPGSGTIIAEYDGDPYYDTAIATQEIVLNDIPTKIVFTEKPPYFVNPEDDVKLSVKVIDSIHDNLVNYGTVTFLHYDRNNINNPLDGQERVIGNPTYLIDGQSNINYVPIQEIDKNFYNMDYNIELIKAHYNYDNNLYGIKWKYYLSHADWTGIAIKKNNNININIKKESNGALVDLDINEDGMFNAQNNDNIYIFADITINNESIVFTNEDKVKIYVENYDTHTKQEYDAYYNTTDKAFIGNITNLDQGTYEIYVVSEQLYNIIQDTNIDSNIFDDNEERIDINDVEGYISQESQHIYVKINVVEANYRIELTTTQNTIITNDHTILSKDTLKAKFLDIDYNDKQILENKKCYFYCQNLNTTYSGTIIKKNNELYALLDEDISLLANNDYVFYAYIKSGKYSTNNNVLSRYYVKSYSNAVTIKTRKNLTLELDIPNNYISHTYPGSIKYAIKCNNIYHDNINIDLLLNNQIYESFILSPNNTQIIGTINNLIPNDYILKAHITNPEFSNIYDTSNTITINKGNLIATKNTYSTKLLTNRNATIMFGLEDESGKNIKDINTNNIQVTLTEVSNNHKQNIIGDKITTEQINDKYVAIYATCNLYTDTEWNVELTYTGDNYFNECHSNTYNIITYTHSGFIDFTMDQYRNIFGQLTYNDAHNQEYVLITTTLSNANETITIINITDDQGRYNITIPNDIDTVTWQSYNNITSYINPHHAITNIFQDSNINNVVNNFKNAFNGKYVQCDDALIKNLYNQFIANNESSLFIGYGVITQENKQNEIRIEGNNGS